MPNPYKTRAQREAARIFAEGDRTIPVKVESFARALGMELVYRKLEDEVSGSLVINQGRATIVVNTSHNKNRRRFTIAHEIGHYILHGKSAQVFIDSAKVFNRDPISAQGTQTQEIDANAFAAELLMPESELLQDVGTSSINPFVDQDRIDHLATRYRVSVEALLIRLTKLGLIVG